MNARPDLAARIKDSHRGRHTATGIDFYAFKSTAHLRRTDKDLFLEIASLCDAMEKSVWVQKYSPIDNLAQDMALVLALKGSRLTAYTCGCFFALEPANVFFFDSGMVAANEQHKGIISTAMALLTEIGTGFARERRDSSGGPDKTVFVMLSGNYAAFSFFYKSGLFADVEDASLDRLIFEQLGRLHFKSDPGFVKDDLGVVRGVWPKQQGKKHGAFEVVAGRNPFRLPLHCDYRNGDSLWRSFILDARDPSRLRTLLNSILKSEERP